MDYTFSFKPIKNVSLSFLVIVLLFSIIHAEDLEKKTAVELESKAKNSEEIWNGDEIRRSISLYQKAGENWKNVKNRQKAAFCFRKSGELALLIFDNASAEKNLQNALQISEKNNLINEKVVILGFLSRLEKQKNQFANSETYFRKSLELSQNSNDESKAFAHLIAGEWTFDFGKFDEAFVFFETAQHFAEKSENKDLQAFILMNLANLNSLKGFKTRGLQQINQASNLWNSINNKRGQAIALNSFGFIYTISNEKRNALNYYRQAESLFPKDVDYIQQAQLNNGIGSIYYEYGQIRLAKNYFQNALTYLEKANNDYGKLASLPYLAQINYLEGNHQTSEKLFQESLNLAERIKAFYLSAILQQQMGNIDFDKGEYNSAISKYQNALSIINDLKFTFSPLQNNLGKAFEMKGDFQTARQYFSEALEINRKNKDVIQIAENLYNLARLNKRDEKYEKALEEIEEAVKLTESLVNDADNQNLQKSFFSNSYDRYQLYIELLMQMNRQFPTKGFALKALQASEKSRSRLMRENLQFIGTNAAIDANPKSVEKENELNLRLTLKREELTNLLKQNVPENELEKLKNEIAQLDNDLQSIKAILRRESPIYSSIKNADDFNFSAFQKEILDDETILLEFFFGKDESYVWLVSQNKIEFFVLPKSIELEPKIDELQKLLRPNEIISAKDITGYRQKLLENEKNYWHNAQDLSQVLFGQFAEKLQNKKIIIVPDSKLRFFPISALPQPFDVKNKPLLLSNEIILEPSASMLYLLKTQKKQKNSPLKDLLIYSDPIFSLNDERISGKPQNQVSEKTDLELLSDIDSFDDLERLNESENEAQKIVQNFYQTNTQIISGFSANRADFLNHNLAEFKILHFSTHGILNEKVPELSGIVLSQYNEQGNKQNGFIWLDDIYRLKIASDLVVLSACDTGIGQDIKGEGLMSLSNGFLQVGAKSVISSHWKVNDLATRELMENFYQILANENLTTSQALRKAKIKMYENPNYRFPYYWASFTFYGDFENKPNINKFNYSNYLYLLLMILFIFGVIVCYKLFYRK